MMLNFSVKPWDEANTRTGPTEAEFRQVMRDNAKKFYEKCRADLWAIGCHVKKVGPDDLQVIYENAVDVFHDAMPDDDAPQNSGEDDVMDMQRGES